MMRMLTAAGIAAALVTTGCAPQLQGAVQVGGRENATWVFIAVQDKSVQGVYRCKETEKGPICQKAELDN